MTHTGREATAASQNSQAGETLGQERRMVRLFCVLAALRLLVFLAAFPFFNNVDEPFHFDLVCKYSHGDVPRRLDEGDAEAAKFIALYTSPEYFYRPKDFPAMAIPPPLWSLPADEQAKAIEACVPWTRVMNHDATQPPVYYAAAGSWYNLGKFLGIRGRNLLYWTRLFNVPFFVLLVWLSYLLTKRLFPDSAFAYLGVPLLLAIFPQTVFYSLNSDVLSAPLVTLSLYWLVRMYQRDAPAPGFALGAGLSGAAAFLTKYTNAPILLIVGLVAVLILWKSWRRGRLLGNLAPVAVLLLAASVPVGCWLARNYVVLGDATGLAAKASSLTWTPKPLGQIWDHPIFTLSGFAGYWNDLVRTFWRGEFVWRHVALAAWPVDALLVLLSTIFLATFFMADVAGMAKRRPESRLAAAICFLLFVSSVALLILGSVSFDFGQCHYPSPAWPYLSSGRLLLGVVVPFLIMFLRGLEVLLGGMQLSSARPFVLAAIVSVLVVSQIALSLPVFASQYNWYHP